MRSKTMVLDETVQELVGANTLRRVQQLVRTCARALADSHGATIVLLDGDQCFYADEDAISPLWRGQRFPVSECISGWAMMNRCAAVIPDIRIDERIPQLAYRPTFVRSLVMVPIRKSAPLGAIGAYWAVPHRATAEQTALLSVLAEAAGTALERILTAAAWW
ncbi:GAF domain-containing protein [Actinoplanes palleronii]|uniref:GAF domain-containing protein n=1 Tax=Actinoplanes palleronii TaxID=113570 RepID=A0ABQ4BE95_9ACTN|nr:GAF domain-containing protein [Actinoplanes palleronii]GIE68957.1 hypothetical protein Apa02nite_050650 [Actinoplanes palleronii]